jgi:hypothetical protein
MYTNNSCHLIQLFFVDYRIVVICSNEDEGKSYFISKLHLFRRPYVPETNIKEFEHYLVNHFTKQVQKSTKSSQDVGNMASVVDFMKYVSDFIIRFLGWATTECVISLFICM